MQDAMMQNAMWVGSIFGPFLVVLGLWMLFYYENTMKVVASLKNSPGVLYMMGVINLLIGLSVLSQYHAWAWGLPFLVTLFGWVVLIRGLMAFFVPQCLVSKKVTSADYLRIKGVVLLVWGFGLCWLAFWMS